MVVERVFNEDDSISLDSLLTLCINDLIEMEVEKFVKHMASKDVGEVEEVA